MHNYRFIILMLCILFISSLIYIFPILAADFDASSTPSDVESGASNQELNFTISNTDTEFNITNVNITLPTGFYFITDSNSTSASDTLFSNTSNVLIWDNTTASGFILNGTVEYFLFNVSVPSGTGSFNFTVDILDTNYVTNTTNVTITVNDTITPSIFNVTTVTVAATTAVISWDTDESSTSIVYYGTNQSALSLNVTNSSLTAEHSIILTSLSMKTTYYYNVSSCDEANNCNTSETYNFTTSCVESWSCGAWLACMSGLQTRTCTDLNNCGTTVNKPSESQPCSVGPPRVKRTWDKITPGVTINMSIYKSGLEFTRIQLSVKNQANWVSITVTKLKGKPAEVIHSVTGKIYQYVQIDRTNLDDTNIEKLIIEFKVSKNWITNNNIDKSKVSLNRYTTEWNKLKTTLINEDSNYAYYSAEAPGFSYFAIGGEEIIQICTLGEKRCLGDDLQECSSEGTAWDTLETCQWGCDSEVLICKSPPPQICTLGEKRCLGDDLQECSSEGTAWDTLETCQFGCLDGECKEKPIDYIWVWIIVVVIIIILIVFLIFKPKLKKIKK